MAAFTKFEAFSERLAKKEFDLNADTLSIYLTNTAPNVATHSVKTDLAEISTGNGYTGPQDTGNSTSRSGGVTSVNHAGDITITASGGNVGPFRYVVLFDDTHASDALIGYWDRGAAITLDGTNGDTFQTDFGSTLFTVT